MDLDNIIDDAFLGMKDTKRDFKIAMQGILLFTGLTAVFTLWGALKKDK